MLFHLDFSPPIWYDFFMKSIKWGKYKMVKMPNHPRANSKGYVKEHFLVVEKVISRFLVRPEEVHHVDLDGHNNSSDNLVLCPDTAYHQTLHRRLRALEACGHADWRWCWICKKYDSPSNVHLKGNGTYQHTECWNSYKRTLNLRKKGGDARWGADISV